MYFGLPLEIVFFVDANGTDLASVVFPLELHFTNGNIIGPVETGEQFFWSPAASVFESLYLNPSYTNATEPDTLHISTIDFGGSTWSFADELCRIVVTPKDTGSIIFTDILVPPANVLAAYDTHAGGHAVEWNAPTFTVVPCPVAAMGDVNEDGVVTTADIIYLVVYIFKNGLPPLPVELAGDADCSRDITTADILYLINYQGRSGPKPCPCIVSGS